MISVYVAGASQNMPRTQRFLEKIRTHNDIMRITHDWTAYVSGTVAENQLPDPQRAKLACRDLSAINRSDAIVVLAEPEGREAEFVSHGLWVELGYAIRMRDANDIDFGDPPLIIVSGGQRQSIFTVDALVDYECKDDREAFGILYETARIMRNA
jgi:hypothetical protein